MFLDFLDILVDIGLISADAKKRREIKRMNKENAEKGVKKKYVLLPSAKVILIILFILIPIFAILLAISLKDKETDQTKAEMVEITESISSYKNVHGTYPMNMEKLIGNRPLRNSWSKDDWGVKYKYSIKEDNSSFALISAGKDKRFDTEDDIVIRNK